MDDYVSKPIDPKALSEALERCLPKKKSIAAPSEPEPDKKINKETIVKNDLMVFDKQALMDRLMGDKELVETVISGFLDDMPRQIKSLTGFINQKNTAESEKKGHQIKGAVSNVGGDVLREIASIVEKAGKEGDLNKLTRLLPQMEEAFDQLKKAMEEFAS